MFETQSDIRDGNCLLMKSGSPQKNDDKRLVEESCVKYYSLNVTIIGNKIAAFDID